MKTFNEFINENADPVPVLKNGAVEIITGTSIIV